MREKQSRCKDETRIVAPLNVEFTTAILLAGPSTKRGKVGNVAVNKITSRNSCASIYLIIASCAISNVSCSARFFIQSDLTLLGASLRVINVENVY